jgi:hypothetical protein
MILSVFSQATASNDADTSTGFKSSRNKPDRLAPGSQKVMQRRTSVAHYTREEN